ncbi:MAG: DUF6805 domain-containing protein, partial [Clostridia bacterium]
DAWGSADAYFSYDMKVSSSSANYLCIAYYGGDGPFTNNSVPYTRDFGIYVNGQKIADQTINKNKPGDVYYCFYEIPAELTEGVETVTVKLAAEGEGRCAGGMLEMRTVSGIIEEK